MSSTDINRNTALSHDHYALADQIGREGKGQNGTEASLTRSCCGAAAEQSDHSRSGEIAMLKSARSSEIIGLVAALAMLSGALLIASIAGHLGPAYVVVEAAEPE